MKDYNTSSLVMDTRGKCISFYYFNSILYWFISWIFRFQQHVLLVKYYPYIIPKEKWLSTRWINGHLQNWREVIPTSEMIPSRFHSHRGWPIVILVIPSPASREIFLRNCRLFTIDNSRSSSIPSRPSYKDVLSSKTRPSFKDGAH